MNKPFRPPQRRRGTAFSSEFLDAPTEAGLARAWRDKGDEKARDRLVLAHRALAWSAAARITRGGRPDEDLIQQANLGLLKAADRFDPDMGFRFSTYATWWVRAEIQDYTYGDWSLIRLPGSSSLRRVFFGLRKAEAELQAEGVAPEDLDAAIGLRFGVDADKIALVRERLAGRDMSLNQPISSGDEGGADWQDMLADPDPEADAEVRVGAARAKARLAALMAEHLARLPARDRQILEGSVMEEDHRTLADLGEEFQISRERVRQLRERALGVLRKALAEDPAARDLLAEDGVAV
ncbi:RNA polymerase sigma-32 factor [Gemmobacter megaterium]|uniref:RNA polymerase sigma-32 factor n=1 Tax=Gemmobacter megaterium TaxID=1086013 RepID=A0A1N7KY25_9RHOB|nr:sigma-70 family RNA polymerase sigma factor [Gemmobacter megaterium]GGE04445.1 RNA polymerase factor sigma-32 [Gemmobacter megaterium]SIS66451.1 RNA polymerase sigma-32 factor [Gemmobacter megaterium]